MSAYVAANVTSSQQNKNKKNLRTHMSSLSSTNPSQIPSPWPLPPCLLSLSLSLRLWLEEETVADGGVGSTRRHRCTDHHRRWLPCLSTTPIGDVGEPPREHEAEMGDKHDVRWKRRWGASYGHPSSTVMGDSRLASRPPPQQG